MKSLSDRQLELQKENELLKKLATITGFISLYYEELPKFKFDYQCFNHLNDLHFKHFGTEKFSSYDSFRHIKNKQFRKK